MSSMTDRFIRTASLSPLYWSCKFVFFSNSTENSCRASASSGTTRILILIFWLLDFVFFFASVKMMAEILLGSMPYRV